jgi:hypothetical protein
VRRLAQTAVVAYGPLQAPAPSGYRVNR